MIIETIISTMSKEKKPQTSPFGIKKKNKLVLISPYLPSTTHTNMLENKFASISYTDNASIFVECIIKNQNFLMKKCTSIEAYYVKDSLRHDEVKVVNYIKDDERPTFECEIIHSENHGSFLGINRARNALIEACILATRINLLPKKKILSELEYLENAILKTSGKIEQMSWNKLKKFIDKKIKKNEFNN